MIRKLALALPALGVVAALLFSARPVTTGFTADVSGQMTIEAAGPCDIGMVTITDGHGKPAQQFRCENHAGVPEQARLIVQAEGPADPDGLIVDVEGEASHSRTPLTSAPLTIDLGSVAPNGKVQATVQLQPEAGTDYVGSSSAEVMLELAPAS